MKFLVFFLLSYALFSCSIAHSEGFYLSGQVGPSVLQDADAFNVNDGIVITTSNDIGFKIGGALGYQWNQKFRGEIEYSYQQNGLDSAKITQANLSSLIGLPLAADGNYQFFNVMINGFWDFSNSSPVTPYLMHGIGGSVISLDDVNIESLTIFGDSITRFSYQFGAGLAYAHSENIDLTLEYRFSGAGRTAFLSHNIAVGARFYLSAKPKATYSSKVASKKFITANSQIEDGIVERNPARNAVSKSQVSKNDPRLLIIKKECAFVTNNPYFPPYTNEFLDCMKERGWTQKK